MAKYNCRSEQHRKWLAQRVLKVLLGYGFVLDFDSVGKELQFVRKAAGCGEVRVYTSIDTRTGAMRTRGEDAIRVVASTADAGFECRFNCTIHRRGTFDTIAKRVAEALRIANWNVENPDKPRWNGTAKAKSRQGNRIRKNK